MTVSSVLSKALDRLAFLHRHLPSHGTHGEEMFNAFDTVESALRSLAQPGRDENCGNCHRCLEGQQVIKMLLCPTCGNKRCPKASDHRLACTNSNAPDQPGSVYGNVPAAPSTRSESDGGETEHTAYHWWCPRCAREVDWREGSSEVAGAFSTVQSHTVCGTTLELRKGSSKLLKRAPTPPASAVEEVEKCAKWWGVSDPELYSKALELARRLEEGLSNRTGGNDQSSQDTPEN